MLKSFAPQGGSIESLFVKEGDVVKKGQVLAVLIIDKKDLTGADINEQLITRLKQQISLANKEIQQYTKLYSKELDEVDEKIRSLHEEKSALEAQLEILQQKLALHLKQNTDLTALNSKGFISNIEMDRQKQSLLETKLEKQQIVRQIFQFETRLQELSIKKEKQPYEHKIKISQLLRQKDDLSQRLEKFQAEYKYTVTASQDGVIASIQVVLGEVVTPRKPLVHIAPLGSELVAEVLIPTRSAGFIEKGKTVRLRFDAFPYQRFGSIEGQVKNIDQALISPGEVHLPVDFKEPVYRLKAQLNEQEIKAYGKAFQLKSGMFFEADIILERRTLIEWVLDPVLSLKGRIN
ncbi:HlyD family secretion protein [Algicola sagamiensis]|uniref:HlyD family secretion protein n=1 Tax=Algicola sagamiensis TaxID=163869 RepID=UPI001FE026BC|nr:HlyD family efflux transporter periplasmic adaptor subunit [Algicola sagamiensis]